MSMPDPPSTQRDRDCATLARAALFPQRMPSNVAQNGHQRPTLFPALEALTKIRIDAMSSAFNANLSHANFFPRRVVVVRPVAGNYAPDELQWNGQPDIDDATASFTVVPRMIAVKCMECSHSSNAVSYVRSANGLTRKDRGEGNEKSREIVLCTNRLLKADYDKDKVKNLEFPKNSLDAVEETLAREMTQIRSALKEDRGEASLSQPQTDVLAAWSSECYFGRHGREVRKGSGLMIGYSMMPSFLQHYARNKCVRNVAGKAIGKDMKRQDTEKLVKEAMEDLK